MTKKVVTVIGARPQFIKAAAISRVARQKFCGRIDEVIVHTGQHHDQNMSQVFFDNLGIPIPGHNLGISGGSHGAMTGQMLAKIEEVLLSEKPDWTLVYGDTNSTLAGALASIKLHIPVAHVEAGLRSFNMRMPEEVNRILTDRISRLLFCPTDTAVANLRADGIIQGVQNVGDVMYDVALHYREQAKKSRIIDRLGLKAGSYILATCHRAENTDDQRNLEGILRALSTLARSYPVVLPLHPRTRQHIAAFKLEPASVGLTIIDPVSYLDMVALEQSAHTICTDSGGVQKEAYFFGVPCVTMREETEWVELLEEGWNQLAGADEHRIVAAVERGHGLVRSSARLYGDGDAAEQILTAITQEAS